MKNKLFGFLLCGLLGAVPAYLLLSRPGYEFFAPGTKILPAPEGDLVALQGHDRTWLIYDGSGRKLGEIEAHTLPVWLRDGTGHSLAFAGEQGLWIVTLDPLGLGGTSPRLVHSDPRAQPLLAMTEGRLLAGRRGEGGYTGYRIFSYEEPVSSSWQVIPGGAEALCLSGTRDGERLSLAVKEGGEYRIIVLKSSGEDRAYEEEMSLDGMSHPEHFWSPPGKDLAYSFHDGCIELHDCWKGERRWMSQGSFDPSILGFFQIAFSPGGDLLYMEAVDQHDYRQIVMIETLTANARRFSSGWLDHYHPVLSQDGRFLAYRQGDLPTDPSEMEKEESLYLFDLKRAQSKKLCDRKFPPDSEYKGPQFSGDGRHVYFVMEDGVYRFGIKR